MSLAGVALALALCALPLTGAGIYRNGIGAQSMSLGGADVATAEGPLGALAANPASLGWLSNATLTLGVNGAILEGRFQNAANPGGVTPRNNAGAWPDLGFALPLGSTPIRLCLGVIPEAAMAADWKYVDTNPGGASGVSYGLRRHRSDILVLRSGVGLGWAISDQLSLGASLGLIYNENELQAPYIFQTQPALRGLKTLLDLSTDGYGWDGQVGLIWHPHASWQFGLSYRSPSLVRSHGDASGDVGTQLGVASAPFHYDAEVVNHFPQRISAGASWQPHERWRFFGEIDWINWHDAFDQLHVNLSHGNNGAINGVVGSSSMQDVIPLGWKDQFVFRAGAEWAISTCWRLRGGYSYGRDPVPNGTLTPLTAAITEHTLSAGVGFEKRRWQIDLVYQRDLPVERSVSQSQLRSGEYSNSQVEVSLDWIGLTTSLKF